MPRPPSPPHKEQPKCFGRLPGHFLSGLGAGLPCFLVDFFLVFSQFSLLLLLLLSGSKGHSLALKLKRHTPPSSHTHQHTHICPIEEDSCVWLSSRPATGNEGQREAACGLCGMRRAAGSKSCTQNLCCIKFFNEFYTRNLTWFYNSPAAAVVVFLARQCLQFLNDFRLRTWHMERKAFAFAFAFEIEPFAALAVFIPCPCPCSVAVGWATTAAEAGRIEM